MTSVFFNFEYGELPYQKRCSVVFEWILESNIYTLRMQMQRAKLKVFKIDSIILKYYWPAFVDMVHNGITISSFIFLTVV